MAGTGLPSSFYSATFFSLGSSAEYFYFGGNVIAELDPAAGAYTDYIFGNGRRIARDASSNGSGVQYYHDDQLGTARIMTDASGTKISDCTYAPFGEEVSCSPNNAANHYKFTGKERDSESGLDNFGARYNASTMGRFMTPDPLMINPLRVVNPQRLNLYSYAVNNPLTFIDPDGKDAIAVNFVNEVPVGGHQAIIVIHADGSATYARFGPKGGNAPYGPGEVGVKQLSSVQFQSDGLPTDASYKQLAKEVADFEGQPATTVGFNYFKTSETDSIALEQWMYQMKALSNRGKAPDYQVNTQNCATFCIAGLLKAHAIENRNLSIIPNRLFMLLSQLAVDNWTWQGRTPKEKVTHKICWIDDKGKKHCQ